MAEKSGDEDIVVIKKYANRRLYNTRSSSYITLDHLSKMTREGIDFKVVDAKTGTDITHQILTQIIMEEEASGGEQILPVNFLRQLIGMYGNSMQSLLPHKAQRGKGTVGGPSAQTLMLWQAAQCRTKEPLNSASINPTPSAQSKCQSKEKT